jgi:serine phosphatase RsbU (regulator of sigma subunit)
MRVEPGQRQGPGGSVSPALDVLADAARDVADRESLGDALRVVAAAARRAADAEAAVVRVLDPAEGALTARAVDGPAPLAAELEGSRLRADELPPGVNDDLDSAPAVVRRAAARAGARALLLVPVLARRRPLASLELLGSRDFGPDARRAAELAAAQIGLVLRAFGVDGARELPGVSGAALELAGEALAAAADENRAADEVTRLAAEVTGAAIALLWQRGADDELALRAVYGVGDSRVDLLPARILAARALAARGPVEAVRNARLPAGTSVSTSLPLGQQPVGVLQLLFTEGTGPGDAELGALATFGARAAQALRASARARLLADEVERSQALLGVVGQATAELSLAHTLETAVRQVRGLLGVDRVAVYLRRDGVLAVAAHRGLTGPHARVAERLRELATGPLRGRGFVAFESVADEPLLADVAEAAAEAGIGGVVGVPLAAGETEGLLAVYSTRPRRLTPSRQALLVALGGQLAGAVENARRHDEVRAQQEELAAKLARVEEEQRQLRVRREIAESFAESLSLEATFEAVTRAVVEVLDVDAGVLRIPDARREQLVASASFIRDPTIAEAAGALLLRPQPLSSIPLQRLFRDVEPLEVDASVAARIGVPQLTTFLERGWTAVLVPISTGADVVATLTLLSFRPGNPITQDKVDMAMTIAAQAALAIDNARLYQQQKEFADTMQRSLLPRSLPALPDLDVGRVYESSARVDVGGDVYDFLELADGRLAVVLGDVTGHGVEATADMAMAKFVFRSLAREHPEPGAFLAAANDVVVGEIAAGKFITMVYVVVDAARETVACAGAGHPPPRVVLPDGTVEPLETQGLVLGVDAGQDYEVVEAQLPPGAAVVLYTDGVIEARTGGDLYGVERLDALLAERRGLPAEALAQAVVDDCRVFAGGELADDAAVVVIKRRS